MTHQLTGSSILQCLLSTYCVLCEEGAFSASGVDDSSQTVTGGYSERCCGCRA